MTLMAQCVFRNRVIISISIPLFILLSTAIGSTLATLSNQAMWEGSVVSSSDSVTTSSDTHQSGFNDDG